MTSENRIRAVMWSTIVITPDLFLCSYERNDLGEWTPGGNPEYYEPMSPRDERGTAIIVGQAGMTVVLDMLQREPAVLDRLTLGAKAMFSIGAAEAEFYLRCQRRDPAAVEEDFASYCNKSWEYFQEKNPSCLAVDKAPLVAEARALIARHWETVITMATASARSSLDVELQTFEFLNRVYIEPDD